MFHAQLENMLIFVIFPYLSIVVKAANFKAYLFVAWLVSKILGCFHQVVPNIQGYVSNHKTIFNAHFHPIG